MSLEPQHAVTFSRGDFAIKRITCTATWTSIVLKPAHSAKYMETTASQTYYCYYLIYLFSLVISLLLFHFDIKSSTFKREELSRRWEIFENAVEKSLGLPF